MASSTFKRVSGLRPGRSVFNLSYDKKFTCDMGQLIPVMADEMVPGDTFQIGNEIVIRFQPLVAPILHAISVYVHYFFVPYRLLWSDWEQFITGGVDGEFEAALPVWAPTSTAIGSLWDYFGFPTGVDPVGVRPIQFPLNAYNLIYNEYYRDETLIDEVELDQESVLYRCWEKDYFTSSLPWQQRGIAPALPISGSTNAVWPNDAWSDVNVLNIPLSFASGGIDNVARVIGSTNSFNNAKGFFARNTVDLSEATTFNVADLRLAFQIQKWLERNARAGARYIEFLEAHFGMHPRDERLQRPEYVGGTKSPVIISEVLQTSETATSPQGNLAGHGLTASQGFASTYTAQEFGVIMGIMSIMPKPAYQQGVNRQWIKETKYDFYFPEFANLSEQAILQGELYATGVEADNKKIFGYQGRFDEMRVKQNMVCGYLRDTLDYWHLGRKFGSAPALNADFVRASDIRKDIFAVQNEPGLIVSFGNLIKAIRPLPIASNPGLIDHN